LIKISHAVYPERINQRVRDHRIIQRVISSAAREIFLQPMKGYGSGLNK
jgi:hypothetical protein